MRLPRRPAVPLICSALALATGCSQQKERVRPGDEPLERLVSASAQAKVAVAEAQFRKSAQDDAARLCPQVIRMAQDARLVIEMKPGRVLVDQQIWGKVPANVKGIVSRCLAGGEPGAPGSAAIVEADADAALAEPE